jgi:glycosyltransferase involved in cell wall biosynthesis
MNIIQITPGTGDSFYCDNCLRDAALVTAMRSLGHEVVMVPMYLPVSSDSNQPLDETPIFFGGINVYLQQKTKLFQKTPRWLDRLFDSPKLLTWLARKSKMTSSPELAETTLSMMRGEHGRQAKELNRLIEWLESQDNRPDIICLSNILLVGLSESFKKRLGAPIVCLLQDEDAFLDTMPPPYDKQIWDMLKERANNIDAFIAVSKYYADVMKQRLKLHPDKVHIVYMGIPLDGYKPLSVERDVPIIGFLSRMCHDKGLDTLVDAFIKLKKNENLKNAKLRLAGGKTGADTEFINSIRKKLLSVGLIDDVQFLSAFDRDTKIDFFQTLSLLSVPEKRPVACALYLLEAIAAGVPVVVPKSGVLPEILEITGGGILHEPNNTDALVEAIQSLLLDPKRARQLGKQGRDQVHQKFNVEQTATELIRIYEKITKEIREKNYA